MNIATMWAMGVVRLLEDRSWSTPAESEWGFGQVLPLLLLAFPFFTLVEVTQDFL